MRPLRQPRRMNSWSRPSANIRRRHLNAEDRQKFLIQVIAAAPEKSDRTLAKETGFSHPTVAKARKQAEATGKALPVAKRVGADIHWISIGHLGKCIRILKTAGVSQAVMAGQVKHKQIFSSIKPDWKLAKLLLSLGTRNTDSLIGGVQQVLLNEGIELVDSTLLLKPLLAVPGAMTKRKPDSEALPNQLIPPLRQAA